jgi:hypothetical protein
VGRILTVTPESHPFAVPFDFGSIRGSGSEAAAMPPPSSAASKSKVSVRVVVSIWLSSAISSSTGAPRSANFRAETITRLSSDPTALL